MYNEIEGVDVGFYSWLATKINLEKFRTLAKMFSTYIQSDQITYNNLIRFHLRFLFFKRTIIEHEINILIK